VAEAAVVERGERFAVVADHRLELVGGGEQLWIVVDGLLEQRARLVFAVELVACDNRGEMGVECAGIEVLIRED
jgi:hypothetical protein